MADIRALRRSASAEIALPLLKSQARIEIVPPATRFIVRGRTGIVEASAAALGFALPEAACRAASAADISALWLGPDEWMVIAPEERGPALAAAFAQALAGLPHAVVDISHRNMALLLSGPKAAYVLAHGCPLDLHLSAFPVGMSTRTLIGRTEAVLWRRGEEDFRLEVWRSFAFYLVAFLAETLRELDET